MKARWLGLATIAGAVLSGLLLTSLHLVYTELNVLDGVITSTVAEQAGTVILAALAALAFSLITMAMALPRPAKRSLPVVTSRLLLVLAGLTALTAGVLASGILVEGPSGLPALASTILGGAAVMMSTALVLAGGALDQKLWPETTSRRFRVIALIAASLFLLSVLTLSGASGLFQHAFLGVVLFWLVTAGQAALTEWEPR